jgi:hypothetical protein
MRAISLQQADVARFRVKGLQKIFHLYIFHAPDRSSIRMHAGSLSRKWLATNSSILTLGSACVSSLLR